MEDQIQPTENKNPAENPQEQKYGETIISWKFPEFVKYQRGKLWYVIAGLIAGAVLLHAFITANFLFAVIVVLAAMLWVFQSRRNPEELELIIARKGIKVGNSFYQYNTFKNFWIIYNPPETKTLYLKFKNTIRPILSVELKDQNPLEIREILLQFLEEDLDKEDELPSDTWKKILKI